jgi:hypothetical protein
MSIFGQDRAFFIFEQGPLPVVVAMIQVGASLRSPNGDVRQR